MAPASTSSEECGFFLTGAWQIPQELRATQLGFVFARWRQSFGVRRSNGGATDCGLLQNNVV